MADVNANIDINIDSSNALAQLKSLQRQISQFHTSIAKSSEAAALAQRGLQKNLLNSINAIGAFTAEMRTVKTSAESFTDSLEKNKFSMREYFRYAGASTKTFGRLFRSEFDTIGKVAEERVKRLQTQYIKMGRDTNGAMRAIAVMPTELNMKDYTTQVQMAAQKQALFNQLMRQGSTNLLNFGKNTQWAGRQLMVGFTLPLMAVGTAATRTFMEMEAQALKFRKVYGDLFTPREETQQALENITELGRQFTKYGVAVSTTVGLAAEAAAAGFQGLDLQRQTTEATRLSILGQIDSQKALETTISLQNAFKMSSESLAGAINFLNAVENQTVVSLDDITTAIPKVAPVIQQLGGDVKDLAFFMAAMKEGGVNASEGANALKSGLAALINPTEKAAAILGNMGVNITKIVETNKGDLKATVIAFAQALDTLDPLTRARAIEQLFGKFQFARLSTLFDNVTNQTGQAARVLDLAGSSIEDLAALSEQELGMTADSAMNKFRKSVEDLKVALIPVGEAFLQAVTPIIDFVGNILEKFNNLSDGTKRVITLLTVGLGAVGPVLLMTFGLIANGVANLIKLFLTLRAGYQRLTGQSQVLGEQTQYLTSEQIDAAAAAHSLDQTHARLTQTFNAEASAINKLIQAYNSAAGAARNFAMNNPGMMMPPRGRKKFASGIVSVPGPKGAGDIIPAMLSPGEAVIPADMAKKYAPLIEGMVANNIPGYKNSNIDDLPTAGRVTGGRFIQKEYSSLAMFGPGNTAGGPGIDLTWIKQSNDAGARFAAAIKASAMEAMGVRQTAKAYNQFWTNLDPVLDDIFDIYKSGITPDIKSIEQVSSKQYPAIIQHINNLEAESRLTAEQAEQMRVAMRKLLNPLQSDRTQKNLQRIELAINDAGETVVKRPSSERMGTTSKNKVKSATLRELQRRGLPLTSLGTYAHLSQSTERLTYVEPKTSQRNTAAERQVAERLRKGEAFKQGQIVSNAAVQGAIQGAAVASPSKKTIPIGEDIARGLQVGMQNQMDETATVGSNLANAAVSSTEKELNRRGRPIARREQGAPPRIIPGGVPMSVLNMAYAENAMRDKIKAQQAATDKMTARMNTLNKAFMGGTFALSALSGIASMAGGNLGKFSEILFQITGPLFAVSTIIQLLTGEKIVKFISRFKVGLGLAGLAIGAFVVGIKAINSARAKEQEAIYGLSNAMKTTTEQVKTLGDFFGVVPKQLPIEGRNREIVRRDVRTARDRLRADAAFKKQFEPTIKTLSTATAKEAQLAFTSLALNLKAQGFATEQVQTIIDALREEAGKTDVKLDVKSLNFSPESIKDLQNQIAPLLINFNKEFEKGLTKTVVVSAGKGGARTYVTQTKEAAKATSELSTFISQVATSAAGMYELGLIDAKQYEGTISGILETTKGLKKETEEFVLIELFKKLNIDAQPFIKNLTSVKQTLMIISLLSSGMLNEQSSVWENLAARGENAALRNLEANNEIEKQYALLQKLQKIIKEGDDGTGTGVATDGGANALQKRIKAIQQQTNAFIILRNAKIDEKTATELSNDAEIASLVIRNSQGKSLKQIIKLVNQYKQAIKDQAAAQKQYMSAPNAFKADITRLRALADLREKIIDIEFAPRLKAENDVLNKQEQALEKINDQIESVTKAQIDPLQARIEANSFALDKIAIQEDTINEKYNKQIDALDKIATLNQDIANIQRQRLSIADALTRGDISAAAQLMQDARAEQAQSAIARQKEGLTANRDAAISALGRNNLEKENKMLQLQITEIERGQLAILKSQKQAIEDSIETTNRNIQAINREVELRKDGALYAGKTKDELDQFDSLLAAAEAAGIEFNKSLLEQATSAKALAKALESVLLAQLSLGGLGGPGDDTVVNDAKQQSNKKPGTDGKKPGADDKKSGGGGSTKITTSGTYSKITATPGVGAVSRGEYTKTPTFRINDRMFGGYIKRMNMGGIVPKYFAAGGRMGSDTVPAMLTPGEFVMNKKASQEFGPLLSMLNESKYPSMIGNKSSNQIPVNNIATSINDNSTAVYNYNLGFSINGNNASANEIARAVMREVKNVDAQRIRGQRQ